MPDHKTVTFDASQYQLVPKEPTEAMRYAASLTDDITNDGIYAAMLAAAPTPAAQDEEHCMCPACCDGVIHASDCAVHNTPTLPSEPCDCGASQASNKGGEA